MLFSQLDSRTSLLIRFAGLVLVSWSVITTSKHAPGTHGRGLVVLILFVVCVVAALWWMRPGGLDAPVQADTWLLAAVGGVLIGASPDSAASAFVFVAVVTAGVRAGPTRAMQIAALGAVALAAAVIVWDEASIGLLAYALGFAAAGLAASNARQSRERADQAELLLAQTQRSHEEGVRAARLEESTRIAREIHDVLAHALAGLTIQLEATTALIEGGAETDQVLARVRRAHALARDGLRETRRAVGALRDGGEVPIPEALGTLAAAEAATLRITGEPARLRGELGLAVLRVVQESLTNVAKHAPGAETEVAIEAGPEVSVTVENRLAAVPVAVGSLSRTGGGFGIVGMRERAQALGGTLEAGPTAGGWRVVLHVPAEAGA